LRKKNLQNLTCTIVLAGFVCKWDGINEQLYVPLNYV